MTVNNRRMWRPDRVARLVKMISVEGISAEKAAKRLGTTEGAAQWQMDLHGLVESPDARKPLALPEGVMLGAPPSAAALRLAQFDPVVARAVGDRLGLAAGGEGSE